MNLFIPYSDITSNVRMLDDRRLIKQILECTHLLSTANTINNAFPQPYKPTHIHHPLTKWVAKSPSNFYYTKMFALAACYEYTFRFNKIHKCEAIIKQFNSDIQQLITDGYCNCTPYKDLPVHEAYKLTLKSKWEADKLANRPPKWTNRD